MPDQPVLGNVCSPEYRIQLLVAVDDWRFAVPLNVDVLEETVPLVIVVEPRIIWRLYESALRDPVADIVGMPKRNSMMSVVLSNRV